MTRLILASASPFRRQLMTAAGLDFDAEPAQIDERAIEAAIGAASPEDLALRLAAEKARDVSVRHGDAFVIGSDQVMSMDGVVFHKCGTLEEAKAQLANMRGKTHRLSSAIAVFQGAKCVWSYVDIAEMTFRDFSDTFLDAYMARAGDAVLRSVGAYAYEGLGQQLFERVQGDYFTIIGLPMIPLLEALRSCGILLR